MDEQANAAADIAAEETEARAFLKNLFAERRARDKDYKQHMLATELGVHESTLSQFLVGAYKSPGKMIEKIRQLRAIEERKAAAPAREIRYAQTTVSEAVYGQIVYAHTFKELTIAYGDPGTGKTMAAEEYARFNPNLAHVVTADPVCETVPALYRLLAEALDVDGQTTMDRRKHIIRLLRGSGKMLIVDEAQLMTKKQLEALRTLREKCRIGMTLIGNHGLYDKMIGSDDPNYQQMKSRSENKLRVHCGRLTLEDTRKVLEDYGMDDRTLKMLHKQVVSGSCYAMRGARGVAERASRRYDEALTYERVAELVKELFTA